MNYLFVATKHGDLKGESDDGLCHAIELELGQVEMGDKNSIHQLSNVGDILSHGISGRVPISGVDATHFG